MHTAEEVRHKGTTVQLQHTTEAIHQATTMQAPTEAPAHQAVADQVALLTEDKMAAASFQ